MKMKGILRPNDSLVLSLTARVSLWFVVCSVVAVYQRGSTMTAPSVGKIKDLATEAETSGLGDCHRISR